MWHQCRHRRRMTSCSGARAPAGVRSVAHVRNRADCRGLRLACAVRSTSAAVDAPAHRPVGTTRRESSMSESPCPSLSFSSTVGTKLLIGLTGLALFVFLIVHLVGNLLLFVGPETFNGYTHALIRNPLIYLVEVGLLADLPPARRSRRCRTGCANRRRGPTAYAEEAARPATRAARRLASSTMICTGLFMLRLRADPRARRSSSARSTSVRPSRRARPLPADDRDLPAARSTSSSTSSAWCIVGLHLWHGVSSAFQSLGVDHPRYDARLILRGGPGARRRSSAAGSSLHPALCIYLRPGGQS